MPIIDDRTSTQNLPLPNQDNLMLDDVARLRAALNAIDALIAARELAANKGIANGYASLGADAKVPAAQLPSYVDDVIEAANFAALPGTGESGKIYVTLDNGKTYRWSGSAYAEISPSPGSTDSVSEGSVNLYFTAVRALAAIPLADAVTFGLVKIGAGLGIDGDGKLFASAGGGSAMSIEEIVPASNGLSSIAVPGGYVAGAILVGVNGSLYSSSDYTATDGVNINFIGSTVGTTDTVTVVKLATVTIGSLPTGSVGTTQLADGSVTAVKINSAYDALLLKKAGGTMTGNLTLNASLIEGVFQITDVDAFEIDPANGTIQTITLGANRTPLATNFLSGQSVTLMVNDGSAFAITWTGINPVWVGGSAPTLPTTGYAVIELWKVGSSIYGSSVGDVA